MEHIGIDRYVIEVLMPDLVGHDRSPAAWIVYVYLWFRLYESESLVVGLSLQQIASGCGLSKTAVQKAVRRLAERRLITVTKASATAVPRYRLERHWLRRRVPG